MSYCHQSLEDMWDSFGKETKLNDEEVVLMESFTDEELDELFSQPTNRNSEWRTMCGWQYRVVNPANGQVNIKTYRCKQYHDCEACANLKKLQMKKQLESVLACGLRIVEHSDRDKLNVEFKLANCLHLVKDDGSFISVIKTDKAIGRVATESDIDSLSQMAVSPRGKRISGGLGKPPAPAKDNDEMYGNVLRRKFMLINQNDMPVNDVNLTDQIERTVIEETLDLDPQNIEQVQDAVYVVENKYQEVAERLGVKILFLYTEENRIYLPLINWGNRLALLERVLKVRKNVNGF